MISKLSSKTETSPSLKGLTPLILSMGNLKLWKTSLMKGVVTNFRNVQSRADGTSVASFYTVCIDKLLEELQRRFRNFDFTQLSVSYNTNPFQDKDISRSAERISSVSM